MGEFVFEWSNMIEACVFWNGWKENDVGLTPMMWKRMMTTYVGKWNRWDEKDLTNQKPE